MKTPAEFKQKLDRLWRSHKFHKALLVGEQLFPYRLSISRSNNKTWLHEFDQVIDQIDALSKMFSGQGVSLIWQDINYSSVGRQSMPVAIEFDNVESLARFLGKWQEWQRFSASYQQITNAFPELAEWLQKSPANVLSHEKNWNQLLDVCRYFVSHPRPACYIRELDIESVDTKFVEKNKTILKTLLDQILPETAIDFDHEKLKEHGFEKRFGLKHEQPRVRFRLLDNNMHADFNGCSDLEIPIVQFAQLDHLLCDRVFITENKTNGLAFPPCKNAIIIFGLGYGLQILKQASWLSQCRIDYWGDIDTHGFAILSRLRTCFPDAKSFLMDEETLLNCRQQWGWEPEEKIHKAECLSGLSDAEQDLYHKLKNHHWQKNIRLEQEKIPFSYLQHVLRSLNSG